MATNTKLGAATAIRDATEQAAALLDAVTLQDDETADYQFVDSVQKLSALIGSLNDLPVSPPSLYIDLEGVNMCRYGTVSIMQIYVLPKDCTYLIDMFVLGAKALTTAGSNKRGTRTTLKDVLESPTIPKVFFDVRNDSDALHAHYGVKLAAIQDLQLMHLATRHRPRFVTGLGKCIDYDLQLPASEKAELARIKERGLKLFLPARGGDYVVFNRRPLAEDIKRYCVQDVKLLPLLWVYYRARISDRDVAKVLAVSAARVRESQGAGYVPHGAHKAEVPKGW